MKSKDLQKLVLSKYEKGKGPSEIFRRLNGALCLRTVKRWRKMIRETGSIELSTSAGRSPTIRAKEPIKKVKHRVNRKKKVTSRKLAVQLNISRTSVRRILKNDLLLRPYKKIVEPLLTDEHKEKRKKISNWVRTRFRKEDTMKILFSDEKLFDIDGIYNSQNDRIWAVIRVEADKRGGVKQKRKFSQKMMVWFAVCSKRVSPIVIFDEGTIDHARYIREVLPVALKYGNDILGNYWTFQQDGAMPHVHHLTQQWCKDSFPSFIDKDHWPPNSPDLNPLDYSIWDELAHAVNWDKITSKNTLIIEVKRAVGKIRQQVVFESCVSWANRFYHIPQNDRDYFR